MEGGGVRARHGGGEELEPVMETREAQDHKAEQNTPGETEKEVFSFPLGGQRVIRPVKPFDTVCGDCD